MHGGIVSKVQDKYYLTQKGKTYASKLDIDALKMEKQGTLSIAITAKNYKGRHA